MPKARSVPEKKSVALTGGEGEAGEEGGRGKSRICERPEDGSRAVRSMFSARAEDTRSAVGREEGCRRIGRVVSSAHQ
jgi:hypothetical protein